MASPKPHVGPTWRMTWNLVRADLRTYGATSPVSALRTWVLSLPFQIVLTYRLMRYVHERGGALGRLLPLLRYWQRRRGCDIAPTARIGRGLRMPHPFAIVIGDGAVIEDDVTIFQQVTLGSDGDKGEPSYPSIATGAVLYANCTVLGAVRVGEGARVGAHAVVLTDVPAGATAVGVPARV